MRGLGGGLLQPRTRCPGFQTYSTEATTMSQLVVTRKPGERIMIDGGRIVVTVVQVDGGRVRVGIEAPVDVVIDREELHEAKKAGAKKP